MKPNSGFLWNFMASYLPGYSGIHITLSPLNMHSHTFENQVKLHPEVFMGTCTKSLGARAVTEQGEKSNDDFQGCSFN